MHALDIRQRLEEAAGLSEVLGAAYDAFTEMLSLIRRYQDSGGPFYAALVMAAAGAADGRHAITAAPSLLPMSDQSTDAVAESASPSDTAASLATLSDLVGSRLRAVLPIAGAAGDLQACEDGARYADEVRWLTTGEP